MKACTGTVAYSAADICSNNIRTNIIVILWKTLMCREDLVLKSVVMVLF